MTYLMSSSNHAPSSPFGLHRSRPRVGWILQRCFKAVIFVAIVGLPSMSWARGGYAPKQPRPFTREELILIDRCRTIARSSGMESQLFVRQCSTMMPYLIH
jgi:hypothetical protein